MWIDKGLYHSIDCMQHLLPDRYIPVDEVSFSVNELHQLTGEAAVKLLGPELYMQQHVQALPSSQTLQLQPPVQAPQFPGPAHKHAILAMSFLAAGASSLDAPNLAGESCEQSSDLPAFHPHILQVMQLQSSSCISVDHCLPLKSNSQSRRALS